MKQRAPEKMEDPPGAEAAGLTALVLPTPSLGEVKELRSGVPTGSGSLDTSPCCTAVLSRRGSAEGRRTWSQEGSPTTSGQWPASYDLLARLREGSEDWELC